MRPRLIAVRKLMKHGFERERREGRRAHDFTWMWQGLGLERPS